MTNRDTKFSIQMPNIRERRTVDLGTLTPLARAMAEGVAETSLRWITIRSRAPMRTFYDPQHHAMLGERAEQPITQVWDGWLSVNTAHWWDIRELLEYEARKLIGFYPIRADGSDLPSTPAARDDDGITADQVLSLIARKMSGPGITKDQWMRTATRGDDGWPIPVRHNGYRSLWSQSEVEEAIALMLGGDRSRIC